MGKNILDHGGMFWKMNGLENGSYVSMTSFSKDSLATHNPPHMDIPELPPLGRVVLLQCISLLLTVVLGVFLFLQLLFLEVNSFILFAAASLLCGPIYAVNIPYMIRYMDVCEKLTQKTKAEIQASLESFEKDRNGEDYLTLRYSILNNIHDHKKLSLSKKMITVLFFTPLFPLVFYMLLYDMTNTLNKHDNLVKTALSHSKKVDTISPKTKVPGVSLKIPGFFLILAAISIISFGMTFFIFSVGFLPVFWIVMLHLKLRTYTEPSHGKRRFTAPLTAAFICFGATAGFVAAVSNTLYMFYNIPIAVVSESLFIVVIVSVIAPIVEETLKPAGLLMFQGGKNRHLPLFYWALYGMFAGLGFALIENYVYVQSFLLNYTTTESLQMLVIRFLFPVHMLGSALVGVGIGLYRIKKELLYLVLFTLLGIIVHGAYNFIMTMGSV
ncbi:MAG: PrsW family glutamic-type intramembrane protease [Thermoplasmata archaeon]